MHNYVSWILLTCILIFNCSNAVPLLDFISFGQSSGDSKFSGVHRGASLVISIVPNIPYFNETYSSISVSSHGYVSFSGRSAFTTPVSFPFKHSQLSVICPFWGDVDQSASGTTHYRSISSSSQIDREIRKYFTYAVNFTTRWALIATWEKVGYYNRHADKVNTFQVVVATNGSQSYAIFNYLDNGIQWSSADSTGGVNGLGASGVQVGFNGGDGVHFFSRPETQSDSILLLDDNSNVCVPGKYVFRIDGETVQPGRCVNIKPDTCSEKVYSDKSPKLIVSNLNNIVSVDLNTTVVDQYKGILCYTAFGIEYDLVNKVIYWSELALGLIRRVSFDNSFNGSAVETIVTGLSRPEQIAIDWVNRKLYWTDHARKVIERSDLDGRNIELVADGIIPQALAIHPFRKIIYWSDLQGRRIERAPLFGQYKQSIVNVARPSGLTIDYYHNLLYWTDRQFNQILSCDLGGNNLRAISLSTVNPYAITVFQSSLYWTDRSSSSIYIVNQFTGISEGNISASLNAPTDIHVLDASRQPGAVYPFIIEDTFIHNITVLAPEAFTVSIEFVAVCMEFNITWELDGKQINDDSNHKIVNTDLGKSRYRTSVKILQSSEKDNGTYTVTVASFTGSDSVSISVKISSYCALSTIQDAYLLFTDFNSIKRINLDGTNQHTVVSNIFNIHNLDFDLLTDAIYWCDKNEGSIYRTNINGNGRKLILSGLVNPEDVTVNWINRKLYWVDSGSKTIEYSHLNGSGRTVFLKNIAGQNPVFVIDQPRALAIDPLSGHIYWTDWGTVPKIEKATLTGEYRHLIITSSISRPSGLTIDHVTSRLYWVDANLLKIETCDLEGRERKVLFTQPTTPLPYGIAVHNGILFWTDWRARSVTFANTDGNTALQNLITSGLRPSGIHAVHYSKQPGALYPYIIKDKFIQHIKVQAPECFTVSVDFISACNDLTITWQFNGNRLTDNDDNYMIIFNDIKESYYRTSLKVKQSSENNAGIYTVTVTSTTGNDTVNISVEIINDCSLPALQDAYLLFTDYNSIQRINLDGSNQHTVISNVYNIHSLDFDILTNTIYWSDINQGNIYRASIDSAGRELIVEGLNAPEKVTIDWINRKLYWCDSGSKTIEFSNLDGSDRMLLLDNEIDKPRGLLINPFSGYIYWTDWGATSKIERIKLSNSSTEIIVDYDVVWPNSLTIDYESSKLYWTDAYFDRVEASNLDGSERTILYSGTSVPHPYGIAVHNDILYWTDWITQSVAAANVDDNTTLHNITFGIRPSDIHVVHHSKQPGACGVNCSCLDKNPYIIINNKTSIEKRILTGDNNYRWENLIKAKSRPLGFDLDIATCTLFWSTGSKNRNVRLGNIYTLSLIDSSTTTIHSGLGYPIQITVNWITRKLYWSDTTLSTIEYSDLDGANRHILLSNVNRVEAIALDPRVSVIYWISFQSNGYIIEKMKLDRTNRHIIVPSDFQAPNSLVINFAASRLYWTDIKKIVTSDLEGDDKFTIYRTRSRRPTALSLYDNELFWAEWAYERVVRYTTDGNNEPSTFVDKVKRTEEVKVIHKSRKPRSCYDLHTANDTISL